MAFMEWNDSFCTGISEFDNHHKKMVELVNKLYEAINDDTKDYSATEALKSLVLYTKAHFASEEQMMKLYDYQHYTLHKMEHNGLLLQLADTQKDLANGTASTVNVMPFLKNWLILHIMGDDKKYVPLFAGKKMS